MNNFNLKIKAGEIIALVGESGCGKSTCIQLMQRFYDPCYGKITLDGHDLTDLDLNWLRDNVMVVHQEPILFTTSIAENIRFGNNDATFKDIEAAAKEANIHDFICKLPLKYDTLIGQNGAQLSGGQKQRIAIARAFLKQTKILLLDEATSALDTANETKIHEALYKVSKFISYANFLYNLHLELI